MSDEIQERLRNDPITVAPESKKNGDLVGAELRYEGRTLDVNLFVNTDEDLHVVLERVQKAARGPLKAMVVAGARVMSPEESEPMWQVAFERARQTVRNES